MGWLLRFNTCSLRKRKPSVPCSILLSNNYVIVKACSKYITGSTDLAHSEKVNLQVLARLSSQRLPSLTKKSWQNVCCFIHLPLIFATQSLVISLQRNEFCISLLSQKVQVVPNVIKDPLLVVSYFSEVVSKSLSSQKSKMLKLISTLKIKGY